MHPDVLKTDTKVQLIYLKSPIYTVMCFDMCQYEALKNNYPLIWQNKLGSVGRKFLLIADCRANWLPGA